MIFPKRRFMIFMDNGLITEPVIILKTLKIAHAYASYLQENSSGCAYGVEEEPLETDFREPEVEWE
jgi:hypothetical protein